MCTNIAENDYINGWGKGVDGWFNVSQVCVSFDHPAYAPFEHAVNIDFMNIENGNMKRVAVELDTESAKELIGLLESALAKGKAQKLPQ